MDIKNLLDDYLKKDTRITEKNTSPGFKEVCDLKVETPSGVKSLLNG